MHVRTLIFVIANDPDFCIVVHDRLSSEGYQIVSIVTPQRAFELLGGLAPDGLIVDLVLPGLNGLELMRGVQEEYPSLPIIVITGRSSPVLNADVSAVTIRQVLTKPLQVPQLIAAVERWFGAPERVVVCLNERLADVSMAPTCPLDAPKANVPPRSGPAGNQGLCKQW